MLYFRKIGKTITLAHGMFDLRFKVVSFVSLTLTLSSNIFIRFSLVYCVVVVVFLFIEFEYQRTIFSAFRLIQINKSYSRFPTKIKHKFSFFVLRKIWANRLRWPNGAHWNCLPKMRTVRHHHRQPEPPTTVFSVTHICSGSLPNEALDEPHSALQRALIAAIMIHRLDHPVFHRVQLVYSCLCSTRAAAWTRTQIARPKNRMSPHSVGHSNRWCVNIIHRW